MLMKKIWHYGQDVILPTAAFALMLAAWELSVRVFNVPVYLLPAPSLIYVETVKELGSVLFHTWATLRTVLAGFLLSVVVSIPLGFVLASSRYASNAIYPLLVLTQAIPKVALAPILVIALGANEMPRIAVTFLVAFFPLVIAVTTGLMATPPELIELGRSYRAGRLQEFFRIRIPFAIPFIFSGLKSAITLSVVGAVVGEFVTSDRGLGNLVQSATAFFKVPLAFGAVTILALLGIVLFQLVTAMERIFFPWSLRQQRASG